MSFLFAVDDESVARGAALRPVAAGVLLGRRRGRQRA